MFFCKNCGTKIKNDNAKFCPNCGQKFEKLQNNKEEVLPSKETKIETVAETINQAEIKNDDPSGKIKNKLPKIKPSKKDAEKGLIIGFIILVVLIIGATGAIIYIHKTTIANISHINMLVLGIHGK
jgi:uncharacterized membrane protein YvbJ